MAFCTVAGRNIDQLDRYFVHRRLFLTTFEVSFGED